MQVMGFEVLAGHDRDYAFHLQGCAGVDIAYPGMRIGAAYDIHMQHVRESDIVDIVSSALEEAGIFLALHAMTHAADLHRRGDADLLARRDCF